MAESFERDQTRDSLADVIDWGAEARSMKRNSLRQRVAFKRGKS